ncbi:phage-related baseplate assembly protein [Crenobacter luteus]|uniref:baseplate assembly protein n=1 Tax=Crenobacter luteus TaxID=1452487 RepID=UPI00104AA5A8|nr:baseplate J/gp47 family protein [Crenobacter luteus]TCP13771.1 phage-related baseplate assembly protein [Crenobacter luteus]
MPIDLTQLPPPKLVEEIDYETLLQQRKQRLIAAMPADLRDAVAATLELESEPLTIELQENVYTEMILRQRINEAAKASMLAYATGSDLDHRAADYGVERLLVSPADPDAVPPIEAVWESDERLRHRCQLALEGLSVAGSRGAYLFHTLSASADVLHARVVSPEDGLVRVYLLDRRGTGVPDQALLDTVREALSAETVRPLCDTVEVVPGQPNPFVVDAALEFEDGAAAAAGGLDAARTRLDTMLTGRLKLGGSVPRSAIYAALQTAGVSRVTLTNPVADVDCSDGQYPQATAITLS